MPPFRWIYLRKCRYNADHRLFLRLSTRWDRDLLIRVCEKADRWKNDFLAEQNGRDASPTDISLVLFDSHVLTFSR